MAHHEPENVLMDVLNFERFGFLRITFTEWEAWTVVPPCFYLGAFKGFISGCSCTLES